MRRVRVASSAIVALFLIGTTTARAVTPECLPDRPLSCSMSWLNLLRPFAAFSVVFADACFQHDLCYRYGFATYGYEKAKCDDDFVADMDSVCRGEVRFLDVATLGLNRVACFAAKRMAGAAVRSVFADQPFRDADSTCCRYDEFGVPLPQCQR